MASPRDYTEVTRTENRRMQQSLANDRRTAVDEIFDHLSQEINTLRLLPGDKISEAEIAARFGVSRQPVRDAFTRLANLDLLLIRPQRATEVKRFSTREIAKSRFVRAAVEAEVLRRAATRFTPADKARLDACLARQKKVINAGDTHAFTTLDHEFHAALCDIADASFAFEVISSEKAKLDRLCTLAQTQKDRLPSLLEDHQAITTALAQQNQNAAVKAGMKHLKRLDETIHNIQKTNAEYFEITNT